MFSKKGPKSSSTWPSSDRGVRPAGCQRKYFRTSGVSGYFLYWILNPSAESWLKDQTCSNFHSLGTHFAWSNVGRHCSPPKVELSMHSTKCQLPWNAKKYIELQHQNFSKKMTNTVAVDTDTTDEKWLLQPWDCTSTRSVIIALPGMKPPCAHCHRFIRGKYL